MSYTVNFATSQTLGIPNVINFTDTSSGVFDTNIDSRRVYMMDSANNYLVELGTTTNYEYWDINYDTISFDVLAKDMALFVTVEWLDAADLIISSKSYTLGFTLYNETFDYQLTQVLSGNPLVINDHNFFMNKSDLRVNIDGGNQSVYFATDIYAAQQCYDRATNFRLNSPYFFNANV